MRTRFFVLGMILVPLLLLSSSLYAQSSSTCQALIDQAFVDLSQSCGTAAGNSACFGHSASATFAGDASGSFAQPGDTVDLSGIQSIQTLPFDGTADQWGLASLNVHANVSLALSETGLKYILLGDTQVENTVAPDNAFQPVPSITVTPLVAANIRTNPNTQAQVIASAPVGTELSADALSSDKQWLRVLSSGETAWVSRQIVAAKDGNIDDLPTVGTNTRTFMQSFFLHTGADTPDCTTQVPSMLVIQTPDGVNAAITVNGVNLRFTSSIALRVTAENNLQVFVLGGGASVNNVSIPAGFTLNVPLTSDGHDAAASATGLRPITSDERTFLTSASGQISQSNLVYKPLSVPTAEQVAATMVQINSSVGGQTTSGPASGQADCSRFKPTSPLGSLALGTTPFYWDGAAGATSYRLNIYGEGGDVRGTFDVDGNNTTLSVNTAGGIGDGANFAWDVQALVNGQVACTTGRVSLPRDTTPQFVGGGGNTTAATPTVCTWDSGTSSYIC